MRTIQITIDERLLRDLDSDAEVRRDGRSAVLRRAAAMYLRRRRRDELRRAYERAYGETQGLGREYEGWEDEGAWPTK